MDGSKISKRSWPPNLNSFKTIPDQDQGWTRHATKTFNYSSSISLWPTLIVLGQIQERIVINDINNSPSRLQHSQKRPSKFYSRFDNWTIDFDLSRANWKDSLANNEPLQNSPCWDVHQRERCCEQYSYLQN